MHSFHSQLRVLALSGLLAAAPLAGAYGQTVEQAAERLKALWDEQGIGIDWDSIDISGSDAVLVGVEVGTQDERVPIGNIALTGVSEIDIGYRIESVSLDYYHVGDSTGHLTVSDVSMTGVILPNEGEEGPYGGFMFYETASLGSVVANAEGTDVFTLTDLHFEVTAPEDGNPMDFSGVAEGFSIDLSVIDDADQQAVLQALGYQQLEGYMEIEGSWNPSDGRMALTQYDFTVVDAGTLGFTFDLGGYTTEFIKSLQQVQKQMMADPDGDSSAQGLAMLGLMQQLSFHGAEIAFTDDSLTNKVIEFVAGMQGVSPSDISNQAKAVLPFVLAQLGNPDLTTNATQAVSKFLDSPGTLRITAAPPEPVPFALIMAGAMNSPEGLTRTLAVTVTAED